MGLYFRQTAEVTRQHHQTTGNPQCYGMTNNIVSTYARILVAASVQPYSRSKHVEFCICNHTYTDRSFVDQRDSLARNGGLVNLHLLAFPVFARHTDVVQPDLIVTILDVLFPVWRDNLIGIVSDGETHHDRSPWRRSDTTGERSSTCVLSGLVWPSDGPCNESRFCYS